MDRRWILGGLLLAGGIGVARLVTARPKVRGNTRILLIGDSFAVGLTKHLKALATEQKVPYVAGGVVGTTIPQWLDSAWFESMIDEFEPTLILVSLGTNDAYLRYGAAKAREYARELVARTPFPTEVVWIGPPALPASYKGSAPDEAVLHAVQDEAPSYFASHELEIPRGPDGLHPNAEGYAGWAGALWDWIT